MPLRYFLAVLCVMPTAPGWLLAAISTRARSGGFPAAPAMPAVPKPIALPPPWRRRHEALPDIDLDDIRRRTVIADNFPVETPTVGEGGRGGGGGGGHEVPYAGGGGGEREGKREREREMDRDGQRDRG